MFIGHRLPKVLRLCAAATLLIFLPSSIEFWNFTSNEAIAQEVESKAQLPAWMLMAQAEHEDQEPQPESDKAVSIGDVELLDDQALENAISLVPAPPKTEDIELPEPFILAKRKDEERKIIAEQVAEKREQILLAQAALNPVAQAMFDEADAADAAGQHSDAALIYLQVVNQFTRSPEGVIAYERLNAMAQRAYGGEFSAQEILAYQGALPTWEQCNTPECKYILVGSS